MYTFSLYRPREPWRDFILSGHGIRLSYRAGQESGLAMLGRVMHYLGLTDNQITIIEANGGEYQAILPSSHALIELPIIPCPVNQETYAALCAPTKQVRILISRDFVDATGSLTEQGVLAKQQYEQALQGEEESEKKVWLTPGQLAAFELVRDKKYRQWSALHGKTKNMMVREKWVQIVEDKPEITEAGASVWQNFMNREKRG